MTWPWLWLKFDTKRCAQNLFQIFSQFTLLYPSNFRGFSLYDFGWRVLLFCKKKSQKPMPISTHFRLVMLNISCWHQLREWLDGKRHQAITSTRTDLLYIIWSQQLQACSVDVVSVKIGHLQIEFRIQIFQYMFHWMPVNKNWIATDNLINDWPADIYFDMTI